MGEAENYFGQTLSGEKTTEIYPNRLIVRKNSVAENWPVFFNPSSEEKNVMIEVKCDNDFKLEHSIGFFSVKPQEHRSFAVKLSATEKTRKRHSVCTVSFKTEKELVAADSFVAVAE